MMKTAQEIVPTEYIHTENTRTPSPRFRSRWSKLRKLNWKASLIMAEYPGVRLYVYKGRSWTNGVFQYGRFSISGNAVGMSSMTFEQAWELFNGISIGLGIANAVARQKGIEENDKAYKKLVDEVNRGFIPIEK